MIKAVCLSLVIGLSGCSAVYDSSNDYSSLPGPTPIYEPKSKMGNAKSYVVWGKRYHVLESSIGFEQDGEASWYGEPFHGRKTSNGEVYDMHSMTAAHKNLPLPTYLHVTNKKNGKEVIVRVNDRGPFHGDRIIDLSYRAAQELGFDKEGIANVHLKAINPDDVNNKSSAKEDVLDLERRWLNVQAFAVANEEEAEKVKKELERKMSHPVYIDKRLLEKYYKVIVGPIKGSSNADIVRDQLAGYGYDDAFTLR